MRRHEILQNVKAFTEIGLDRKFDRVSGCIRHQAAHACQLLDLFVGASGSGIRHHVNVIIFVQTVQKRFRQLVVRLLPGVDDRTVAFFLGGKTSAVSAVDLVNRVLRLLDQLRLHRRNRHVGNGNRHAGSCGVAIAHGLDMVQNLRRSRGAVNRDNLLKDSLQVLLLYQAVDLKLELILRLAAVDKAQILRDDLIEEESSEGRGDKRAVNAPVLHLPADPHRYAGLQGQIPVLIGKQCLADTLEDTSLALCPGSFLGQIVDTQNHVLRRDRDRSAVRRLKQVVGRQHQEAALRLRFHGKRKVNRHLVAVKVGVESSADKRMKLDGLAFHQDRFKCLNTETVQCGSAVEHNGMLADDVLQNIPDLRLKTLHHLLRVFDIVADTPGDQFLHNEGLEQLNRHLLGQSALIDLQFGAYNDNRTARIVDTLAQQILAEAAALSFKHIGQGLERTVPGTGNRSAPAAIVDQGVHSLLKHALLIAHDDIRCAEFKQSSQAVVAVDDAPVEIVQVAGRKTSAVQLDHGS